MSSIRDVTRRADGRVATYRALTVAGLLVSAFGILVQGVAGVEMPVVPPGVVIMVVAALVVAIIRLRWIPVIGILAAGSELFGFFAVGAADGLVAVSDAGLMIGAWLRLIGAAGAVVAGICTIVARFRR